MSFYRAIPSGGKQMIYLGTSTSGNVKTSAPDVDYTKLTKDNFIVEPNNNIAYSEWSTGSDWEHHGGSDFTVYVAATASYSVSKSYDASTGAYSCSISTSAGSTGVKVYLYVEE